MDSGHIWAHLGTLEVRSSLPLTSPSQLLSHPAMKSGLSVTAPRGQSTTRWRPRLHIVLICLGEGGAQSRALTLGQKSCPTHPPWGKERLWSLEQSLFLLNPCGLPSSLTWEGAALTSCLEVQCWQKDPCAVGPEELSSFTRVSSPPSGLQPAFASVL